MEHFLVQTHAGTWLVSPKSKQTAFSHYTLAPIQQKSSSLCRQLKSSNQRLIPVRHLLPLPLSLLHLLNNDIWPRDGTQPPRKHEVFQRRTDLISACSDENQPFLSCYVLPDKLPHYHSSTFLLFLLFSGLIVAPWATAFRVIQLRNVNLNTLTYNCVSHCRSNYNNKIADLSGVKKCKFWPWVFLMKRLLKTLLIWKTNWAKCHFTSEQRCFVLPSSGVCSNGCKVLEELVVYSLVSSHLKSSIIEKKITHFLKTQFQTQSKESKQPGTIHNSAILSLLIVFSVYSDFDQD